MTQTIQRSIYSQLRIDLAFRDAPSQVDGNNLESKEG